MRGEGDSVRRVEREKRWSPRASSSFQCIQKRKGGGFIDTGVDTFYTTLFFPIKREGASTPFQTVKRGVPWWEPSPLGSASLSLRQKNDDISCYGEDAYQWGYSASSNFSEREEKEALAEERDYVNPVHGKAPSRTRRKKGTGLLGTE